VLVGSFVIRLKAEIDFAQNSDQVSPGNTLSTQTTLNNLVHYRENKWSTA